MSTRNGADEADAYPHAEWLVMRPCIVEIDRIVIREVQYQLEVNWCRNEEVIVKGVWGAPGLVMGPCIVEIDRIVIREVQYQFEVNRCRNEELNLASIINHTHAHFQDMATDGWKDGQTEGWKDGQTTPKQHPSAYDGGK
ncbi:hypothetical protein DPMN_014248 [Dreissena polymorpha]|uniref:Uncharacterized protein n=1 Tax=Dreissena polymorpha TaxID=45954 RepID=A0A9D4S3A1_DREPO|nr:hypothetical protein DPMN_014248 [Dreissena polymorpha]